MKVGKTLLRMLQIIGKHYVSESTFFAPASIIKEKPLKKEISQEKSISEYNLAEGD